MTPGWDAALILGCQITASTWVREGSRPWCEALGLGNGEAAKDSHRSGKLDL